MTGNTQDITKISSFDLAASSIVPPTKYSDNMNLYNSALFLDQNITRMPSVSSFADGLDLFRSESFMMSPTANVSSVATAVGDNSPPVYVGASLQHVDTQEDATTGQSGRKRTHDQIPGSVSDDVSLNRNKVRVTELPGKRHLVC